MENQIILFTVLALLLGGTFGFVISAVGQTTPEPQTIPVENPINQELQNQVAELNSKIANLEATKLAPVSKVVEEVVKEADLNVYLDDAEEVLFSTRSYGLGDDSVFLTCDGHEFDLDEVSIYRVNEWSYTWQDDDLYSVSLDTKMKFADDSDERTCKESREYIVSFEDGEDPVVETIEAD